MTTRTPHPAQVDQAEQEARDAQALLDALEDRIRDGDPDVTPDQLTQHRDLARFAQLRVEAARRNAERQRTAQRHQQYTDVAAELADQHDDQALEQAFDKALAAARHLVDLAHARAEHIHARAQRASAVIAQATQHEELDLVRGHGLRAANSGGVNFRGRHLAAVDPSEYLALLTRRALLDDHLDRGTRPSNVQAFAGTAAARTHPRLAGPALPGVGHWPPDAA